MSRLVASNENIIEPTVENLQKLLSDGKYIICGDLHEKGNSESLILENVFCKRENKLISFCVSNKPGSNKFRLHDDSVVVGENLEMFIRCIAGNYDVFIIDCHNVDRKHIYGKLGTTYENKVVYEYK